MDDTPAARPVAVDLFAGAGGMSLGFEQAGFDVRLAVEADGYHAAAHERNFPHARTLCRSVVGLTAADVVAAVGGQADIDLLFGGPPCQGFSHMGQRDTHDPRNGLIGEFVRLAVELHPKAVVMENVPGLVSGKMKPVLTAAASALTVAGYRVTDPVRPLDASRYGVPQRRKRLFLLAVRADLGPALEYPAERPGPPPTVWEALADLPDVDADDTLFAADEAAYDAEPATDYARAMRGRAAADDDFSHPREWDGRRCTGCLRVRHTPRAVALYAATPPGQMVPSHKLPRLDPDGLAPTLRAGSDSSRGSYTAPRPIHPRRPRCVTAREAARLHGFPDWFAFYPLKWHAYRQIGNAVCPPVARAVGRQVMAALGRTPVRPKYPIRLSDAFRLPADRPRGQRRLPQVVHFPPVVAALFAATTADGRRTLRFTAADIHRAISVTGAELGSVRPDTFVDEIARSRNAAALLAPCLSRGYTVRRCDAGGAVGEFVQTGHPDGIDRRAPASTRTPRRAAGGRPVLF
jgi:DNA (cytosine-5)-methyltransferase 1